MLSDDQVHQRLLAWAWWRKSARQGDGFPTVNILHPSWMPPAGGRRPGMRVSPATDDRQHREIERAVSLLSRRLRETVQEHYLQGGDAAAQARRLQCAESTRRSRLQEARRWIGEILQDGGRGAASNGAGLENIRGVVGSRDVA